MVPAIQKSIRKDPERQLVSSHLVKHYHVSREYHVSFVRFDGLPIGFREGFKKKIA